MLCRHAPPRQQGRRAGLVLERLDLAADDGLERDPNGILRAFLMLEQRPELKGMSTRLLRALYRLGLRSAQLPAHNWANNFADSCCSPPKFHGLNERGRAVVREPTPEQKGWFFSWTPNLPNRTFLVMAIAAGVDAVIEFT